MNYENEILNLNQNLILENRSKLILSGVKDVISFDDSSIVLNSTMGNIIISGMNLHINKLNTETLDMIIDGKINAITYSEEKVKKNKGFYNIFK